MCPRPQGADMSGESESDGHSVSQSWCLAPSGTRVHILVLIELN
jgi:hypothetical protein